MCYNTAAEGKITKHNRTCTTTFALEDSLYFSELIAETCISINVRKGWMETI